MRPIWLAMTVLLLWVQWSPFLRGCLLVPAGSSWKTGRPWPRSLSLIGSRARAVIPAVSRVLLVALLLAVPAALPALAYATPPDPSWINGMYDDADYDDVVVLVTSGTGNVGPTILADLPPIPPPAGGPPPSTEKATFTFSVAAVRPRAPPVS